ncbi:MAG: 1-deoxy-D-xylulose-5-phosphate synthase [Epsilonproteobacteria bacterium]|nr:1-deoxy-D-xylulose-5-phosphate synthase [Campylobacterota bacterium]
MAKPSSKRIIDIDIRDIKGPEFLKELNYRSLDLLSEKIRREIIDKTSKYGGHLSSNLGVVEITIALHRMFNFKHDKLIFDVGHQSYTHKILTGRSLEYLRNRNGVSGFQKICESYYDCFEAGHSSTSLSAAQGFALNRDARGEKYDVVAVIGDGSIVNGLAFEALNNISHNNNKVIIILNDNEMSISRPTGGMGRFFAKISTASGYTNFKISYRRFMFKTRMGHALYNFTSRIKNAIKQKLVPTTYFDDMGFQYIGCIDGHNIKALEKAIARAKRTPKSVVLHIATVKGKGYRYAENDTTGYWHGVTPFEIESGKPKNLHPEELSWSHLFSDLLTALMAERNDLVIISPATVKGSGLEDLFSTYPKRTFDVGIAEGHALTLASGLAVAGTHPIVSIYSTFMQRAFDQIIHDIARMNLNITFLVDRSGLVGLDGETHQGIYDESFLLSTPNTVVTMPSSDKEAKYLLNESLKQHGPFFIRYPRDLLKKNHLIQEENHQFGKWIMERVANSKRVAVIAVGQLLRSLKELIIEADLDVTLVNALFLKPHDQEMLSSLSEYETIVIYDAYATEFGFASYLKTKLCEMSYKGQIKSFAIPDVFVTQAKISEQLEEFGLLPKQVFEEIKKLL